MLSEALLNDPAQSEPLQPSQQTPLSPPSAWRDLVNGHYRISAWYDLGGRRYVVARRRPESSREPLTPRQRRALALRAKGTGLKVIAFEAGVSVSTVSHDLSSGMRRLGLTSTSDFVAVLGHVGR